MDRMSGLLHATSEPERHGPGRTREAADISHAIEEADGFESVEHADGRNHRPRTPTRHGHADGGQPERLVSDAAELTNGLVALGLADVTHPKLFSTNSNCLSFRMVKSGESI